MLQQPLEYALALVMAHALGKAVVLGWARVRRLVSMLRGMVATRQLAAVLAHLLAQEAAIDSERARESLTEMAKVRPSVWT